MAHIITFGNRSESAPPEPPDRAGSNDFSKEKIKELFHERRHRTWKALDGCIQWLWAEFYALLCLWVILFPHPPAWAGLWKSHLRSSFTSEFQPQLMGISICLFSSMLKLDEPQAQPFPVLFLFLSSHHICSSVWVSISSPRLVCFVFLVGTFACAFPSRYLLCHTLWLYSEEVTSETPILITPLCQAQARDSPPVSL